MLQVRPGVIVLFCLAACAPLGTGEVSPQAVAGEDVILKLGESVTLDARASTGNGLGYAWRLIGAPAGSDASLGDGSTPSLSFRPDVVGLYLIELVVSQGGLMSAADLLLLTVRNDAPRAVIDCGLSACSASHGGILNLSGSESSDGDGDSLSYTWQQVTTDCNILCPNLQTCTPTQSIANIDDATAESIALSVPDEIGTSVVVRLDVGDGFAEDATCVSVPLTNAAPVVLFSNSMGTVNPAAVDEGSTFFLEVSSSPNPDPDGDPVSYQWSVLPSSPAGANLDITSPNSANTMVTAPVLSAGSVSVTYQIELDDGFVQTLSTIDVLINDI